MIECNACGGNGIIDGCPECGTASYTAIAANPDMTIDDSIYRIPSYYKKNLWSSDKLKTSDNDYLNSVLKILDRMVYETKQGGKISSSYMFMLPYGYGKKTAMFTIIQNYIENGHSVAPVVDVASLAILENNFRLNEKESVATWNKLINSELVCVYGVDFSARYHTTKLYLNLCSIRGLQGRPTLLFAENSLAELRSAYIPDHLDEKNNNQDVGCKLSHPYILDGVKASRGNK